MSTVERNVYCASYSLPYSGNESLVNAMHKSKNLYNATLWYYRQALEEHWKSTGRQRKKIATRRRNIPTTTRWRGNSVTNDRSTISTFRRR